jgi:hypothetical protein
VTASDKLVLDVPGKEGRLGSPVWGTQPNGDRGACRRGRQQPSSHWPPAPSAPSAPSTLGLGFLPRSMCVLQGTSGTLPQACLERGTHKSVNSSLPSKSSQWLKIAAVQSSDDEKEGQIGRSQLRHIGSAVSCSRL